MALNNKDDKGSSSGKVTRAGSSVRSAKRVAKATVKGVKALLRVARMVFRAAHRLVRLLLSLGLPGVLLLIVICLFAVAGAMVPVLQMQLKGFQGLTGKDIAPALKELSPKERQEIDKLIGDDIRYAMDCSSRPPSEARPGVNCIEGLLEEKASPIPEDKEWLIPIWQAAGDRYRVPWEVVAAVNATRTHFGDRNCEEDGVGFYRVDEKAWGESRVNAGTTKLTQSGVGCWSSQEPGKIHEVYENKRWTRGQKEPVSPQQGNYFDAVDASFAAAKQLAREGAYNKQKWDYSGSPSNSCTAAPSDGRIDYLPNFDAAGPGGDGALGYNKNLKIPRDLVVEAAKWRSDKGKLKPRRPPPWGAPGPSMPTKTVYEMVYAAWVAFGADRREAESNARKNMAQIQRESSFRPYLLQGYIGDVNDNNPAGGLFQFIPETFETWKVAGFNDRFNPLDNILAAVNAQVNSGMGYILSGASGWGPGSGSNPYTKGGKVTKVAKGSVALKPKPYKGKPQTDPISRAVRSNGDERLSDCYVAVVHDWYAAIEKADIGAEAFMSGPANVHKAVKIKSKGKLVEIPSPPAASAGMKIDNRILPNVLWYAKKYKMTISQGLGINGVSVSHSYGTAIDLVPGPGGSWDLVDKAAYALGWERSCGENGTNDLEGGTCTKMAPAIRFIGYDGYRDHGRGNHLHVSWRCSCGEYNSQWHGLADWVMVFPSGKVGGNGKKKGHKHGKKAQRGKRGGHSHKGKKRAKKGKRS